MELERPVDRLLLRAVEDFAAARDGLPQGLLLAAVGHFEDVGAVAAADFVDLAREDVARFVDQRDVVADLLHRRHVVRREDDRRALVAQRQDFVFQQIGVDRVEARERLVEDQQLGFVQDRDDELHLLGHAFRKFLHLLVPPLLDAETDEPLFEPRDGFAARKALEAGEEDGLFADLHLLVETPFLGQIADAVDVVGSDLPVAEQHAARVGRRDAVDDADQGRLAGSVGSEQSVDRTFGDGERYVVERRVRSVAFGDVFYCE